MKKNIFIFCVVLTTLSLTAFGIINRNASDTGQLETKAKEDVAINTIAMEKIEKRIFSDFIYDVGPRFGFIKKGDLDNIKSFSDFISDEHAQRIVTYKSLSVIILEGDRQTDILETVNSGFFTAAQVELLQSFDYSTNFKIRAEYVEKNMETGQLEDSYATPHLTIVPEKQAEYTNGKDGLIGYLKENSKEYITNVQAEKLQPAKLYFTVSKKGTIENVKLDRTSNYPTIDKKMIELIIKVPGTWNPAENSIGEKIDQELVISFGLMGC